MSRHRLVHPLPSRAVFFGRLLRGVLRATIPLGTGLGIGVLGYHVIVGLPWLDALLNASMLLGGEGPLAPTPTSAGKLFASFYALFSGLLFVTMAGLVLAPAIHRVMHRFHLEASEHDAVMMIPMPEAKDPASGPPTGKSPPPPGQGEFPGLV